MSLLADTWKPPILQSVAVVKNNMFDSGEARHLWSFAQLPSSYQCAPTRHSLAAVHAAGQSSYRVSVTVEEPLSTPLPSPWCGVWHSALVDDCTAAHGGSLEPHTAASA
eukprot:9437-Heterococcus_DN1.PRE.2